MLFFLIFFFFFFSFFVLFSFLMGIFPESTPKKQYFFLCHSHNHNFARNPIHF